jgi:hypothetical protein
MNIINKENLNFDNKNINTYNSQENISSLINIDCLNKKENENDINLNENLEIIQKEKLKQKEKPQKNTITKNSILDRIILPQIKKQIEYYFSDKNYYKDSFLLEEAKKNNDDCKINKK